MALRRWFSLLWQLVFPARFPGVRIYLFRCLVLLPAVLLLAAVQLINTLCLLLDNILFPRYRQLRLHRPVFILGVPRSGTTHTHHLLSADSRFTTLVLWEAVLAPSILQRHLLRGMARLASRPDGHLARLLLWIERRLQSAMSNVHPTGLRAPEEDFLLLMPSLDCFLLVLLFPDCDWLWRLSRGDESEAGSGHRCQTERVLRRYRRLLQRHLYCHGEHLQLLSKNASFAGLARMLHAEFPDSLIIVCERDATLAVRSQLRSLAAIRQQLHVDQVCPDFELRLLELLHFYYRNLDCLKRELPPRQCASVSLWMLSRQPRQVVRTLYSQLSIGSVEPLDPALEAALRVLETGVQVQPATPDSGAREASTTKARELERFHPWRHVPEHRL